MAAGDPYHSIKDEVDAELQLITGLQAKLFAGHSEAAPQLRSHLADVGEQLHALEAAVRSMVDNPARFQLDSTTAFMRQVEVETLRFQYEDVQKTSSQAHYSSAHQSQQQQQQWKEVEMRGSMAGSNGVAQHQQHSSTRLPPPPIRHSKLVQQQEPRQQQQQQRSSNASLNGTGKQAKHGSSSSAGGWSELPPPGSAAAAAAARAADGSEDDTLRPWDTFNYETAMQQQMVQQQDEDLDHISLHVDRIKQQGMTMNEELEQQSLLLGGLEEHTDTTSLRLRGLRSRVADVIRRSRQDKQLCTILVLLVLLVVLTMIALA